MADAFTAHDEAMKIQPGRRGVISLALIESAVNRPYSGYFRPISKKAAALLQGVVRNHGFVDGNKRTAWLLVEILIDRSGYELNIRDDEPVDDLVVDVATKCIDFDDLVSWFKLRLIKKQ